MATGNKLTKYSVSLHELLGHGIQRISIVTSALLAAISLFYVFTLASHLQVIVYYFLLRWTYLKTSNDFVVTRYFDSIIISSLTVVWLVLALDGKLARISVSFIFGILLLIGIVANHPGLMSMMELTTLPVIVFLLFCQKYYQQSYQKRRRRPRQRMNIVRNFSFSLTLNYLVIVAIILGIYSILISFSLMFGFQSISVDKIYTSKQIPVDNYAYEIFIFFSALSPLLLIVIFFCLPIKLLMKIILQRIRGLGVKWWLQFNEQLVPSEEPHRKKTQALYLSLFVLFSIALVLIPQLPTVNKDNQLIGTDSEVYVEWITSLQQERNMQDFLPAVFLQLHGGDRPLSLIFLFLVTSFINAPISDTIEYLPIVLGPALVFVVYFLTRELTLNDTASLFAASLTGLGYFHVSTGIYAGFYANWIALLVVYTSLIFFFRFLKTSSKASLLVCFALLLATLFSHAYTWSVLTIVMSIFLIVSFLVNSYPRRKTILLLLVVLSTVVIDITIAIIREAPGGVEHTVDLAQSKIVLRELGLAWETLVFAIQNHFGGVFSNVIILGLVIYWFVRSNLRTDFNIFITIFLMIGIPPLFLGDWVVQSRVFYNIPFQIPAAIALTYISRQKFAFKILTPMYVWLIAMAIWTVSNFYEVSPS